MKKMNKKGFTLAELLIVVAIIAVLVAVAIPVFTSSLEKSRQATDVANIRAAYAEAVVAVLDGDGATGYYTSTSLKSKDGNFGKIDANTMIGDMKLNGKTGFTSGNSAYVCVDKDGKVSITTTAPTADYTAVP